MMSAAVITDEVNTGGRFCVELDRAAVDALTVPQIEQGSSEGFVTHAAEIGRARTCAGRSDSEIGRVATKAEAIGGFPLDLAELNEWLTQGDDIGWACGHL
jgi:hypothetical protein